MKDSRTPVAATKQADYERRWRWTALLMGGVALVIGCNPATLAYFLIPWVEDKVPARVKLAGDKEVTVVVMSSFGYLETHPEHQNVDQHLGECFAYALKKRFDANKDKIKIVPLAKVRSFVNSKSIDGKLVDKHEVGKHFQAEYVIALEITKMGLYEFRSPQLLRGNAEISWTVFDLKQPQDEAVMAEDIYRIEYPTRGPIDAGNSSVMQFRTMFLNRIGRDLSRIFAAHPSDERSKDSDPGPQ